MPIDFEKGKENNDKRNEKIKTADEKLRAQRKELLFGRLSFVDKKRQDNLSSKNK